MEKEIRENLDQQRQQLEQELSKFIGSQPAVQKDPERPLQSGRCSRKPIERLNISPEPSKTGSRKRKLSTTRKDGATSNPKGRVVRNGAKNRQRAKSSTTSETEAEQIGVDERGEIVDGALGAAAEETQIENEFNDALEELFQDTASEA